MNDEAKARYGAVENTTKTVVTPRKYREVFETKKEELTVDCKILSSYHNALKGNNPYMIRLIWCIARTQERKYAYEFFLVILKGNKNACSYKSTVTKIFLTRCFTQEQLCIHLIEFT